MNRAEYVSSTRLAGSVKRYHTWLTLQQQTTGEHTFHVLRIWWEIYGPPRPEITTAIIWHDMGELKTGDVPFPVKRDNLWLKQGMDDLEDEALAGMSRDFARVMSDRAALTDTERLRVKICDLIEMHEFGNVEVRMGNTLARPIVNDTYAEVSRLLDRLPAEDRRMVERYSGRSTR